jgi:exopolysaccharide biosynthesis predicted pyruvyltransferase EpsI
MTDRAASLLPPEAFVAVFEPLLGRRIGFVQPLGNAGDLLIKAGTVQLLSHFGIDWIEFDPGVPEPVDELVFGGGGNMGYLHPDNVALRASCMTLGLPMTILPQSYISREDAGYHRVWVRERISLRHCRTASLAPDLALGYVGSTETKVKHETGLFLREDPESAVRRPREARDPALICGTPAEYLELAAQYAHIVTDRLYFAIAGMIVGREVTLLPNTYHKNQGVHEAWLADLGCHWARSVRHALTRARRRSRQQI